MIYDSGFTTPDIDFSGDTVPLHHLTNEALLKIAERSPIILYSLNEGQRKSFWNFLEEYTIVSPVVALLKRILQQIAQHGVQEEIVTTIKTNSIQLKNLIGQKAIEKIQIPKRGGLWRAQLLPMLQQMFFSEKSSFGQSGIFAGCTPSGTDKPVYHSTEELMNAQVTLLIWLTVDSKEHTFLPDIIKKFSGKVGRLLAAPRQMIRFNENGNESKIGVFEDIESKSDVEVVLGDETQRYKKPKIDENSWAIIVPLCPTHTKQNDKWVETGDVKFYAIEEAVVQDVANGGSRKALAKRSIGTVEQIDTLKPGETRIMEIPIDIWPYDADIEVVCVDGDGTPVNVIHFPATYLDAVRTFADGENRMQVEIKNMWTEPIIFKKIHFRVRLFETDTTTHEKFRLRRRIQEAEKKWFYGIEHLVYTEVLKWKGEWNLSQHTAGLWHLANLDNLFPWEHMGLIFSQEEKDGLKNDKCEIIQVAWGVSKGGSLPLAIERSLVLSDLEQSPVWYQEDFVTIMKKGCSVGREKGVIFVCRSNIDEKDLREIVEKNKVTDVFCIPGHDRIVSPEDYIIKLCKDLKIKLTSIEIKSAIKGQNIEYDLIWKERK
jgi:hypothetical protein